MKNLVKLGLIALFVTAFSFNVKAQGDVNEAIELFNKAIEAYQGSEYDKAIELATKAHNSTANLGEDAAELKGKLEKSIPQFYYGKAANLLEAKKYAEAMTAFDEATKVATQFNATETKESIDKALPQLHLAAGKESFDAEKYDEAIAHLSKAATLDPSNSTVYLLEGAVYTKQGNSEKAEEALIKCVALAKESNNESDLKNASSTLMMNYLQQALAANKAKKWADTYAAASKALEYGDNINGYKLKGAAATQLKKWDDVISVYSEIMAKDPKEATMSNYSIATAYEGKGNKAKACEFYKKIVSDPKFKALAEHKIKEFQCK